MAELKSVAFHTLGCKLNFSETSALSRLLLAEGFEKKNFEETADVYVINSCSVTDNADKECRHLVRRIRRNAPASMVVITGCYAQLKPQEIAAIPGVDLVLGAAEKFNIVRHLKELTPGETAKICSCDISGIDGFHPSFSVNDRTRSFLKVQDGCSYNCSFCTIPLARGASRSDTIGNVVATAATLAKDGVREIILTGVNLGDFGKGNSGTERTEDFFGLLKQLDQPGGADRYRISSIEPNLLTDEIIDFVAGSSRIMPHFHIPLQSGSDRILSLMRRRYKRDLYAARVQRIKKMMPHCAIGVDVITGFPGETEEDFNDTRQFLADLDISYLHVFTYSERADTKALEIKPVVPPAIRAERNKTLRALSFRKMEEFTRSQNGQIRNVLFEYSGDREWVSGYSDNYIRITTAYKAGLENNIVNWAI